MKNLFTLDPNQDFLTIPRLDIIPQAPALDRLKVFGPPSHQAANFYSTLTPTEAHPSQQLEHGAAQAALLGQWWEQQLRDLLRDEGLGNL